MVLKRIAAGRTGFVVFAAVFACLLMSIYITGIPAAEVPSNSDMIRKDKPATGHDQDPAVNDESSVEGTIIETVEPTAGSPTEGAPTVTSETGTAIETTAPTEGAPAEGAPTEAEPAEVSPTEGAPPGPAVVAPSPDQDPDSSSPVTFPTTVVPADDPMHKAVLEILDLYRKGYSSRDIDGLVALSVPGSVSCSRKELEQQFKSVEKIGMSFNGITVETGPLPYQTVRHHARARVHEDLEYLFPNGDVWRLEYYPVYYIIHTKAGYQLVERAVERTPLQDGDKVRYINGTDRATRTQDGFMHYLRGLQAKEHLKKAAEEYEALITADEDDYLALGCRGLVNYRLEEYEKSAADFEKALSLAESKDDKSFLLEKDLYLSMLHRYLGFVLHHTMDYTAASKHLRRSLRMNPAVTETRYILGLTYMDDGQVDRAEELFEDIVAKTPEDTYAAACLGAIKQYRRGTDLIGVGQFEGAMYELGGALDTYQRFMAARRKFTEALAGLADMSYDREDFDQAIQYLHQALSMLPDDPENCELYLRLGTMYMRKEDYSEAARVHSSSVACKQDYFPSLFGLAAALFKAERYEEAMEAYKASLNLAPDPEMQRKVLEAIYGIHELLEKRKEQEEEKQEQLGPLRDKE